MKKALLVLVIGILSNVGIAQTNQSIINYNLTRPVLEQVGGDLVITDPSLCPDKPLNKQPLFQAFGESTVFFEINNTGGGNACVTLIVDTASGSFNVQIPENTQSGVLKYNEVKQAFLILSRNVSDQNVQTLTSVGFAKVWF